MLPLIPLLATRGANPLFESVMALLAKRGRVVWGQYEIASKLENMV